jgi:hypothetical protein
VLPSRSTSKKRHTARTFMNPAARRLTSSTLPSRSKANRSRSGDIAARLNVRHVLEGSVRKAGNRVRVTAQLVDASNGYQLWSERYDRQLADIFDVQDEIARAIVERLKVAFAAGATPRLVKVTTSNMEAYQEYLKGRAMLYRRGPWIARAEGTAADAAATAAATGSSACEAPTPIMRPSREHDETWLASSGRMKCRRPDKPRPPAVRHSPCCRGEYTRNETVQILDRAPAAE